MIPIAAKGMFLSIPHKSDGSGDVQPFWGKRHRMILSAARAHIVTVSLLFLFPYRSIQI